MPSWPVERAAALAAAAVVVSVDFAAFVVVDFAGVAAADFVVFVAVVVAAFVVVAAAAAVFVVVAAAAAAVVATAAAFVVVVAAAVADVADSGFAFAVVGLAADCFGFSQPVGWPSPSAYRPTNPAAVGFVDHVAVAAAGLASVTATDSQEGPGPSVPLLAVGRQGRELAPTDTADGAVPAYGWAAYPDSQS